MFQVVAENDFLVASKHRRQQQEKEESAVFEALWTEDLNAKRLRERRDRAAKLKRMELMKEALLEQVSRLLVS